jgi:hypothetical protein
VGRPNCMRLSVKKAAHSCPRLVPRCRKSGKAPHDGSPRAFIALWPAFASYAISYLFVGVVWINHHHLLRYTESAEPSVIWSNLLFLFFVCLIPFFTSYMAENHMNSFATALYAVIFLLITIAFNLFQLAVTRNERRGGAKRHRSNCQREKLDCNAFICCCHSCRLSSSGHLAWTDPGYFSFVLRPGCCQTRSMMMAGMVQPCLRRCEKTDSGIFPVQGTKSAPYLARTLRQMWSFEALCSPVFGHR